jgi:hypothetical protein
MNLIVLMGLMSIEKAELAALLANHVTASGRSAVIIDGVQRMNVDREWVALARLVRLGTDGGLAGLPALVSASSEEVAILAAPETAPPDAVFAALAALDRPGLTITTAALIDLRTCDCFPHLREELESSADVTVELPYALPDVLRALGVG